MVTRLKSKMRPSKWVFIESMANTVLGSILAQLVLVWGFGISLKEGIAINASIFVVSFARAYVLRVFFRRIYG